MTYVAWMCAYPSVGLHISLYEIKGAITIDFSKGDVEVSFKSCEQLRKRVLRSITI